MRKIGFIASILLICWMIYLTVAPLLEERMSEDDLSSQPSVSPLVIGEGIQRGNAPPDFQLATLSGEAMKLSDLKGKKIILNFWASWCGPCQAEMPDMESYYRKVKGSADIGMIAVNLTQSEKLGIASIEKFIHDYKLTFPIVLDREGEIAKRYGILALPTTLLIDSDGKIAHILPKQLDERLLTKLMRELK